LTSMRNTFPRTSGSLAIVPFVFGGFDAITGIDNIGLEVGLRWLRLITSHVVIERRQINRGAGTKENLVEGSVVTPAIGTFLNLLQVPAVLSRGFVSSECKLSAIYSAAITPPRCPVPRPSRRSWDKKRTSPRMRSELGFPSPAMAGPGRRTELWPPARVRGEGFCPGPLSPARTKSARTEQKDKAQAHSASLRQEGIQTNGSAEA
jgi:hypothetical protein